ncbi:MAG: hypothetical protein ABSB89_10815 [Candidatus Bathyarchaeia archaeon]|jgi:hypothetical protein
MPTEGYQTVTITQKNYDVLEYLSIKSKASRSQILNEFLEQVEKVVYPLGDCGSHINYLFQAENGDMIICRFSAMTFSKHFDHAELDKNGANEMLDDKLEKLSCDELANKLSKAKAEAKKKESK